MNVNKMHIIIPKKSNNSSGQISKEDLLRNLKEITPEQLTTIDEEMRIAREKREAETEQEMRKKHGQELSSFEQKINGKKPKNLTRFFMEDSKIIEN
ncbi:hypothetical protein IJU97_02300 [bacterium]|nr:hypothetical protein [bacterium]